MKLDVILGLQWGDEGKGKMIDVLCPKYDVVARYQGGPNAGHTIIFDDKKVVLHTLPSGFCRPNVLNVIGNGVVINPIILKQEAERLVDILGQELSSVVDRLIISSKASLILPTHPMLDQFQENQKRDKKIGSTLKGIGPCYTDKVGRAAVQIGTINDADFDQVVQHRIAQHIAQIGTYWSEENQRLLDETMPRWMEAVAWMRTLQTTNTEVFIQHHLHKGARILAEGAQGAMLDVNFGTYPYVTSSTTTTSGVCQGLGIAPQQVGRVFGVFKAYTTRVGEGPFPTELSDETGAYMRQKGNEFGATTGRPRRCGWLDIPLLNYAVMINGVTDFMMMKMDVLTGMDTIQVAEAYELNGKTYEIGISDLSFLKQAQLHYKTFPAWKGTQPEEVLQTQEFQDFLNYIEQKTSVPFSHISYGPNRNEVQFIN